MRNRSWSGERRRIKTIRLDFVCISGYETCELEINEHTVDHNSIYMLTQYIIHHMFQLFMAKIRYIESQNTFRKEYLQNKFSKTE
jgi:hypothetical protein